VEIYGRDYLNSAIKQARRTVNEPEILKIDLMKAIVLTCDKYHPLADLMMHTYQKLWPDNPFVFRVPYENEYPASLKEKYKGKIELIRTDYTKQAYTTGTPEGTRQVSMIKPTALTLLNDIEDDEWIYWCMDDRYLMKIDKRRVSEIYHTVLKLGDPQIAGVSMLRRKRDVFYKKGSFLLTQSGFKLLESVFSDSEELGGPWAHQFMRCKVLRRMFESFPDRPFAAKEMDFFPKRKLAGEKIYDAEKNLIVFGESTSRGELTINCFLELKRQGLKAPAGFNISTCKYHTTEDFRRAKGVAARAVRWLKYKYTALLLRLYGVKR
jgi:hypothetical protein